MKYLIAAIEFLLFVTATAGKEQHDAKSARLLSLFNVVKFENGPCSTSQDENYDGTCYSKSDCQDRGGASSASCAAGFGVCCTFSVDESGQTVSQNNTYLRNPEFPSAYNNPSSSFSATIRKCDCDVCYFRLDFDSFTLAGPVGTAEVDGGACTDTFDVTRSSGGETIPQICGENSGKHIYVDVGSNCGATSTLNFNFDSDVTTNRRWEIKVSQISCFSELRPPADCLEYHLEPFGRITSFNFDAIGETHLANQEHQICIRPESTTCCVQYSECQDDLSFTIMSDDPNTVKFEEDCDEDYVAAKNLRFSPRADQWIRIQNHRSCGAFGAVTFFFFGFFGGPTEALYDCTPDYRLLIHTNGEADTTLGVRNRGVCLNYRLVDC